jgi:hypothetical protein
VTGHRSTLHSKAAAKKLSMERPDFMDQFFGFDFMILEFKKQTKSNGNTADKNLAVHS